MDPLNQSKWQIELVSHRTFERVLPLIAAYQRFYEMTPDEERNRAFFAQFLDDQSRGAIFGAFDDAGEALGFATLYFIPSSLSAAITCTFNDLYSVPGVRGGGVAIGVALQCFVYARGRGFQRISWLTHPDNKVARRIYEYTNATREEWCSYDLYIGD
jgi:RimJ/RimL family protein N-acetyltransferase